MDLFFKIILLLGIIAVIYMISRVTAVKRCKQEQENGDYQEIAKYIDEGHTYHCACRLVWGDGECECQKENLLRKEEDDMSRKRTLESEFIQELRKTWSVAGNEELRKSILKLGGFKRIKEDLEQGRRLRENMTAPEEI